MWSAALLSFARRKLVAFSSHLTAPNKPLPPLCRKLPQKSLHPKPNLNPHHSQPPLLLNLLRYRDIMHVAYFRRKPDDDQVHIHFHFVDANLPIDRVFNLSRNVAEPVTACMQRIQSNVQKELQRKQRKSKKSKQPDPPAEFGAEAAEVTLIRDGREVCADLGAEATMLQVFGDMPAGQSGLSMRVFGSDFRVAYNLPWVHAIALPTSILAGYFVYPAKLELEGCDYREAVFTWFVSEGATDTGAWTQCGTSFQWQVSADCVGRLLKVVCEPRRGELTGPRLEAIAKRPVQSAPAGECHYVRRHEHTQERLLGDQFRVVSYNLLADYYADSDYSRAVLFPYISAEALHIDYRKQLFVRELHGYRADVMCLQEVDAKIFEHDLVPVFGYAGCEGRWQRKGTTADGVATFWDGGRFDLIESVGINIGEAYPQLDCLRDIWSAISQNPVLAERIAARSTAVQVTVLRSRDRPGQVLCIANTHLYFHPDADHIRLLQFAAALRYVGHVRDELLQREPGLRTEDVSILFCGDFNSTPECGIFRLATEQVVPADFVDFKSNPAESPAAIELRQPFRLSSAYPLGSIPYTNYTVGFTECIDYIFFQLDGLQLVRTVPPPSNQQLAEHTAIPSVLHPSDHVALIADFEWR